MQTSFKAVTAAMATLVVLGSATLQAQTNNASISATAVVQQPINVTGAVNMAFGNVFPGVTKAIALTDAGAGRFDVTGQSAAAANLSFTLPTTLVSGANTLPIGSWTGEWNGANSPTGGTNFTPAAALTPVTFSPTGTLFVFVGATVTPATTQPAGTYTGSVQMTVTY